jgi:hypothetical protein
MMTFASRKDAGTIRNRRQSTQAAFNRAKFAKTSIALAAFAAASALGIGEAAADWKTYPGMMCVQRQPALSGILAWNESGGVENLSARGSLTVTCPALKTSSGRLVSAWVNVTNGRSDQFVSCTRRVMFTADGTLDAREISPAPAVSVRVRGQALLIFPGAVRDHPRAIYFFTCTIPPMLGSIGTQSVIHSYNVGEGP